MDAKVRVKTPILFGKLLNILEHDLKIAMKNKDKVSNIVSLSHSTAEEVETCTSDIFIMKWSNTLCHVFNQYNHWKDFDYARELVKDLYPTDEACKQNCINDELRQRIKNYVNKFSKYMEWRNLDKMIENYNKGINDISANEYQEKALRTAGGPNIENGLMGLCGEAGECIDILKKHRFQGHDLDREHLAEELGDVAWYLAVSAAALGYDLSDILNSNVEKLKERYPDGFEAERSVNRKESSIRGIIDIDEMYGKK